LNLILLFPDDFVAHDRVVLSGRRLEHVTKVHRATVGQELVAGVAGGRIGTGVITRLDAAALEMTVSLERDPPAALPATLVLALPRPKVLNRVMAGAASLGVKRIILINAWRVEKSYWKSPRMTEENLRAQSILGLEQARDTVLPVTEMRRFFRPFVKEELPAIATGTLALAAHPAATRECPRAVQEPVTLVIGPEGGFIGPEVESLQRAGVELVTIGDRILRVETAVAALIARLF
jgi:16S rRNA (uracil1498-N3)-methyltransferase